MNSKYQLLLPRRGGWGGGGNAAAAAVVVIIVNTFAYSLNICASRICLNTDFEDPRPFLN